MSDKRLRVGVLGCGAISDIYLKNLTGRFADAVEVVGVTDVMIESAKKRAEQYKVAVIDSPGAMLEDRRVELVMNLTPAPAHFQTTRSILQAGKHVYSEKPLSLDWAEAVELAELARSKKLRLAVAPDTILGAGVQSVRHLIDSGKIGAPAAVQSQVWLNTHTERYFGVFRGPLMDLAPYPVAAMLSILGPVKRVSGVALALRTQEKMPEGLLTTSNPGNAAAALEFASGVVGTITCSAQTSRYLITTQYFGSAGWIEAPDPNMFTGSIKFHAGYDGPVEMPITHELTENFRGVGVWEMALAIAEGRPHRLSAELSLHTLEVMLAVVKSSQTGQAVALTTSFEKTPAMPALNVATESTTGSATGSATV
jgi:predicted dehydrogenase